MTRPSFEKMTESDIALSVVAVNGSFLEHSIIVCVLIDYIQDFNSRDKLLLLVFGQVVLVCLI